MNNKIEEVIERFRMVTASSSMLTEPGSIMGYSRLCDCNSNHMCNHRREALCEWLEKEMKSLLIDATIKALD